MKKLILKSAALAAMTVSALGQGDEWTRRDAEHLLNRAGFGAGQAEIDAAVARGREATIDGLFVPLEQQAAMVPPERASGRDGVNSKELREDRDARRAQRRVDRNQLADYTAWWFDAMVTGEDPLRDRMTLFWHGYFTSSFKDVKSSYQMIQQNQMFRAKGLGSFDELLLAVAKDPAMLEYLDNDENKKGSPNENFAREVMELFTLGEGHYSEDDIKEAARAFTGWRNRRGEFSNSNRRHDGGEKTILGKSGQFDGDDVLGILLQDESCAPHVAGRLLTYFEGSAPSEERKAQYGAVLLEAQFSIESFLRALFRDSEFYRDEIVGQRVAGPVDYLVGISRRLDLLPPRIWMSYGTEILGQQLFYPPSVKGWDGGMAWMTTASFMQRGNLAGVLLGVVDVNDIVKSDDMGLTMEEGESMGDSMDEGMSEEVAPAPGGRKLGQLKRLRKLARQWNPNTDFSGDLAKARARTAEDVVDLLCTNLLAIELPSETRTFLIEEFARRKTEPVESTSRFGDRRGDESMLRSFAHLILSLPEAQLN